MKNTPEMLTVQQVADLAGMSRSSIWSLMDNGKLVPDLVVGTRRFFNRSTVDRWLAERERLGIKKRGPVSKREQTAA